MLAFDVFRHWETDLRPFTLSALRHLTPEQLHWRPDGWHRSAWDLAVHMCETEWRWIYRNALRKVPWEAKWDRNQFGSLQELTSFWSDVHRATLEWLQDSPVTELNRKFPMPYTDFPAATMGWVIHHVMEQEGHHRGQLFMLMRMQGLSTPDLTSTHRT